MISEDSAIAAGRRRPLRMLGAIPRPISGIAVSEDLSRALIETRAYLGDAWVAKVVRK
jgi:hypothetical protein